MSSNFCFKDEKEIHGILKGIMQAIEEGISIVIQLPPMAPFVKPYYNTLKTARETIGRAA